MELKEFEKKIKAAVESYIADEETYDDNAQLQIDPATFAVTVVDSDEAESDENAEADGKDYIDVMELVKMSPADPGKWLPDAEAIEALASEYFN